MSIRSWTGSAHLIFINLSRGDIWPPRASRGPGPALLTVVSLLLAAVPLARIDAQDHQDGAQLPRYRVEVVVFEQLQPAAHPEDPGRPPMPPVQEDGSQIPGVFIERAEPLPQSPPGESPPPPEFEERPTSIFFKPAEAQDLLGTVAALERRSGYRVLAHESWVQPGFARDQASGVDLSVVERLRQTMAENETGAIPPSTGQSAPSRAAGEPGPPEDEPPLTVTATLWLGRYLHLELDAQWRTENAVGYLKEARRMRSGEPHYFDSPRLGAIAVVVPETESGIGIRDQETDTGDGQTPRPTG